MLGMFTAAQNRERLARIEAALKARNMPPDERAELEEYADELRQWLMDLWRIEGGGAE